MISINGQGYFLNDKPGDGFELRWRKSTRWGLLWRKDWFEFWLNEEHPLTFCMPVLQPDSCIRWVRIQPDRHVFITDMGSIPPPAQPICPRDEFLCTYLMHDSAYKHHGLYIAEPGSDTFAYRAMSRLEVDALCLQRMITVEGAKNWEREVIYRSVRLGGAGPWANGEPPNLPGFPELRPTAARLVT